MTTRADSGTPTRVALAIGTALYTDPEYQESEERSKESDSLSQSVPRSLSTVVEAFGRSRVETKLPPPGYLLNPRLDDELRPTLADAGSTGDIVIIYYTGHGEEFKGEGYFLITTDFRKTERWKGLRAREVPRLVVKRRDDGEIDPKQPPTLLILDCCFSGAGGLEVLRDLVVEGTHPNLWVWATAGKTQYATSGVFARALAHLLRHPNVGSSSECIHLDTVLDVINHALDGTGQCAQMFPPPGIATVPRFFPNRNYVPDVAGLTVTQQYWISKARGGPENAGAGFYLTGRTGRVRAAADLVRWIIDPAAGNLAVVTGSPGTGKSALLSLPVLLTDPASRDFLLTGTAKGSLAHQTAELLPLDASVVAVHARGLNTDQVAQAISDRLGRPAPGAMALLDSFDEDRPRQPAVVIVDGVEEATAPTRLRDSLLVPLAEQYGLRVILGARRHVLPARDIPATEIDLDTERYGDPKALLDYVRQLLVAGREPGVSTPYHDTADEAGVDTARVAAAIADLATSEHGPAPTRVESFLIARVIALAVRARPEALDTSLEAWTQQLPDGLAAAFDEELNRLGDRTSVARVLLEALAWARGPGLPWETIWVAVARAVARTHGPVQLSKTLSDDDVRWLLDKTGAYVVEDLGPGGRSVFRPFHDRLAEYLRAQAGTTNDYVACIEAAITSSLLDTLGPTGARRWDRAHPYLRTYLGEHAIAAGTDVFSALLGDGGFLATADPSTLIPLLSQAPPDRASIVRSYRRARPLLGDDPAANAAYLQEAALAVSATEVSLAGTALSPTYHTKWTHVRPDESLLTVIGHTGWVGSVAFGSGTNERSLLATGGDDGTVRVWDLDTGDPVCEPLTGHTGWVQSVAFGTGAGGRPLLASGGNEGTVRVWGPDNGDPVCQMSIGHSGATLVAFGTGAGGRPLLASGGHRTVQLWDPDNGDPVGRPLTWHSGGVESVAFFTGATGRPLLASGWGDGTVRVWYPDNGDPVCKPLTGHTGWVQSVAFFTRVNGRPLLASAGDDGVRVWDLDTGDPVCKPLTGHADNLDEFAVRSVAFGNGADGRPLLASADAGTVRVWDLDTGDPVCQPLIGHTGDVLSVAFGTGPGGPLLASASRDGTARVWDLDASNALPEPLAGHPVVSLAFGTGAGGRPLLASASRDGIVRMWNPDTGDPGCEIPTGHMWVKSVAFGTGAGGRPLLASAGYSTVQLWDPNNGNPVGEMPTAHKGWVELVALGTGADGRPLLASFGYDGLRVWDLDNGDPVGWPLTEHTGWVMSMAFGSGADGRPLLATGGYDGVLVWDPDTGEPVGRPLTEHTGSVRSVAFGTGAGGRPLLASGGGDGIRTWDPDTGEPVGRPLTEHTGWVESVVFGTGAAGRPLLASGADDRTVRLWDPDTGLQLLVIRRRTPATALASHGSRFAVGDEEGLSVIDFSSCDQLRRPS